MSGSRSIQRKHCWLHFVNYLMYTSILLTMASCSQDRFRTSYQGVSAHSSTVKVKVWNYICSKLST